MAHVESAGPDSLRVFWKPLPANLSRGEVTEYKVQWGKRGKPYHESEQVGAGIHEFIITGNQISLFLGEIFLERAK